jgi:LDH2 family malate/lactate/ureidoglycolate dehydrogenase
VAKALVQTSLRGIDTHGISLFPTYVRELDGGRAAAAPVMTWRGEGKALCLLDAGGALGVVAGHVAADGAVRIAKQHGLGAVAVRNSNHFGAAGAHALRMADQGALGLCLSNSDALVSPCVRPSAPHCGTLFGRPGPPSHDTQLPPSKISR